jgi:hypothetical protein
VAEKIERRRAQSTVYPPSPHIPLLLQNKMSNHRVKSILHNTTLIINSSKLMSMDKTPITLKIVAKELDYGPVIDLTITADVAFTGAREWSDHPFLMVNKRHIENDGKLVSEIIDDTPAIRAVLAELCSAANQKLYTTTDCTHRAHLIAFLVSCWS